MPLVSVVMLSYNHASFIAETIKSVLNQSLNDLELIIVDDASKDKSRDIITNFKQTDNRVKAIFHERNMGIAKTTNDGIRAAEGKYIAFIDSDDLWHKDKLEKQVKILAQNEDLVVWSEGEIINEEGKPTGQNFTELHGHLDKMKSGYIIDKLLKNNYIFESSAITAMKNLKNIEFSEQLKYINDWLFFVELAKDHEYFFIDEPLAKYRIHSENTNRDSTGFLNDYLKITKIFNTKYKNLITKEVKSMWYAQIASLYDKLGLGLQADFYILKRFLVDPANNEDRYNLRKRLKTKYLYNLK